MRILIVDDDRPTVEAIVNSIAWQALGIDAVLTAYSVAQAKHILQSQVVDIVVSDIEMPKESGLELLEWVRRELGDEIQFLLLTCHEKFTYAASAVRLAAAEYLTKPFDAKILELSLGKVLSKLAQERQLQENSRYGQWRVQNERAEEHHFWLSLFGGATGRPRAEIRQEAEARSLSIDTDGRYRLIVSKITEYEASLEEMGQDLLFYVMESVHSRILYGKEENYRVVRRYGANGFWLFIAVPEGGGDGLCERCANTIRACMEAASVKVTVCVGNECTIEQLPERLVVLEKLIAQSVALYGQAFTENEAVEAAGESQVLEMDKLEKHLLARDKVAMLNYLKEVLHNRTELRTLNERTLYFIQQEVLQAIYAHLMRAGMQASQLFHDESSVRLSDKACRSSVDMLRWINYLLEQTLAYEDDANRQGSLVERINRYIHTHYQLELGRNEIAAEFHMAPEYLAKLYHKKTGKYLKDYIREYKMVQAKRMLRDERVLISDVAAEVGFDNFSYFSTLFKKHAGMTPQEYRRQYK